MRGKSITNSRKFPLLNMHVKTQFIIIHHKDNCFLELIFSIAFDMVLKNCSGRTLIAVPLKSGRVHYGRNKSEVLYTLYY